ncbi:hypothetical protein HY04AAS1_1404 [Hydrogenobaculum sp. Y04AAS1]|nr:hypothetical protein HY04AAS1_1404 [Hydrogenobaculum sp. Y04AAS1]
MQENFDKEEIKGQEKANPDLSTIYVGKDAINE